ncbi:MAG: heparinase [Lentisphaerae bacterium]|jgi:hypothetical protein|nr:heparinase [Lentisphaerota bacterium]MBT5608120.1 heparinase [Lentisphaerota bacterium]MBT7060603.1 heparinase [Lentisphaerota bacterium]MBT7847702.1 heparinase [Lentisphaerota bacterium]
MLSQRFSADVVESSLKSHSDWHPYPCFTDRASWDALPGDCRETLVSQADALIDTPWPPLPARRILDYVRDGDRSRYEALHFGRRKMLSRLVLGACVSGGTDHLDSIVDGIWAICEESFWGVPAHIALQRAGAGLPDTSEPVVDLFVAETAALLAWALHLMRVPLADVSPLIAERVEREIEIRVLTPCRERDDFWWMAFNPKRLRVNNWNPWINSNWLTCILAVERDDDRRLEAVLKSMRSIDRFIDTYPGDGGCDEGPSYWGHAGASLFDCLELLSGATDGTVDVYAETLIGDIGRYIHRAQICDRYFVDFADASALVAPPPGVVYGYGCRVNDPELKHLGAWLAQAPGSGPVEKTVNMGRKLAALFKFAAVAEDEARQPLTRDVWLPDTQIMVARDREGTPTGLTLAAKGGHNAESHNHNDVGSFLVYADGCPLIVDAGVGQYTAQTFSSKRYELWTMQSAFHSLLPTVDRIQQAPGDTHRATEVTYSADDGFAHLTMELAPAYPKEAGIRSWIRTIALERGKDVAIHDQVELDRSGRTVELSFLTPSGVAVEKDTLTFHARTLPEGRVSGTGHATFAPSTLAVSMESVPTGQDSRLATSWGTELQRVIFAYQDTPKSFQLTFRIAPS